MTYDYFIQENAIWKVDEVRKH